MVLAASSSRARSSGRTPLPPASARDAVLTDTPHWRARSSSRTRRLGLPRFPTLRMSFSKFPTDSLATLQRIFRLCKFSFRGTNLQRERRGWEEPRLIAEGDRLRQKLDLLVAGIT